MIPQTQIEYPITDREQLMPQPNLEIRISKFETIKPKIKMFKFLKL
jgi:hypothetical protein